MAIAKLEFHPGETLVLNTVLPFSVYDVKAAVLSFRDDDGVVFEATATGFVSEDYTDEETGETIYKTRAGYTMNQSETVLFKEKANYSLQINVYGYNGSRIASREISVRTLEQQLPMPDYFETQPVYTNGSIAEQAGVITSYNDLTDKPKINGVVFEGDWVLPNTSITHNDIDNIFITLI